MKHFASNPQTPKQTCAQCRALQAGPCHWFDTPFRQHLQQTAHHLCVPRGETLVEQGERGNFVGIILSGLVKVAMTDEDGNEHVLQILHRGEIIGHPVDHPDVFAYMAATEVELCVLPERTARHLFESNQQAYAAYLRIALRQQLEQHFTQLSLRGRSSLERLAYWISTQVTTAPTPSAAPVRLELSLTRRDLASLLDMTIETLCRNLHQLETRGAIRLLSPKLLEVTDRKRLLGIARDTDPKLAEAIRCEGWEWGAVPVDRDGGSRTDHGR